MALILTEKQKALRQLVASDATYIFAYGGSRSGKTAAICNIIEDRAIAAPNGRFAIFKNTATGCRRTLFNLTYPQMSKLARPGLWEQLEVNKTDMTITYPNGSMILFGGLEENNLEKILGDDLSTIYVNEATSFNSFETIELMSSRLSQVVTTTSGQPLRKKFFIDCNPSHNKHWAYKLFEQGVHPISNKPLRRPENYAKIQMNPMDNVENIGQDYIEGLLDGSDRHRRRFLDGGWTIDVEDALFKSYWIDENRVHELPDDFDFIRTVVAVDPATTSTGDETGIVVVALGEDKRAYVLEDCSVKGTPDQWSKAAIEAYERHNADLILYESNQGGEMVASTLKHGNPNLPVKGVHASKGKIIRAEPISKLYADGKVSHMDEFKELEDQMLSFTHDFDRKKNGSPDRLDALVWGLTELMFKEKAKPAKASVRQAGRFANY